MSGNTHTRRKARRAAARTRPPQTVFVGWDYGKDGYWVMSVYDNVTGLLTISTPNGTLL